MSGAKLPREDVERVAVLARLHLTDAEVDEYAVQLGRVLEYVEMLGELDMPDVDPLVHAIPQQNVLRDDVIEPSLSRESALSNAPKSDGTQFLVPPILGEADS